MSSVCVYSFADATGLTKYVDDVGDFLFTGTWSGTGTYTASPLMAAQYGIAYYMAIRDNIGDNPQRIPTTARPASWSIMSLLYEYQCSGSTAEDALAEAAWELAQSGTNIAWAAYYLAQIGTNTGTAAYTLAGSAFDLAGSAYSAGTDAYNLASSAYSIAVDGTNAAAAAQATADAAYLLAQIGTNTGTAAYNLAVEGTVVANAAYALAESGTNVGNAAFSIAVIGTNTGTAAYNLASAAYALAQIGTNTGTAAYTLATAGSNLAWDAYLLASAGGDASTQAVANFAYYLAQVGTNTGTAAYNTAIAAGSLSFDAYLLAQIGTNTGTAAYTLAGSAYALAGHKAVSVILCSAYTPASTGADSAEVPVPHSYDGSVVAWNANRFTIRVQTAGSMPSAAIEKSEGVGSFTATSLGTVTLSMNAYEGSLVPASGTVNSGDKLRFYVLDPGTAQNWTIAVELGT